MLADRVVATVQRLRSPVDDAPQDLVALEPEVRFSDRVRRREIDVRSRVVTDEEWPWIEDRGWWADDWFADHRPERVRGRGVSTQ